MALHRFLTILSLVLFLNGCAPVRLFYHPNNVLYVDPLKLNLTYEMMEFESANGTKLFGLLFRTKDPPKGVVVHFHGNFGNVSNHFMGSAYLINYGFDVFVFDYEGFGGSEGRPSPQRTIEDGVGAVRFAGTLNRNPAGGIVLLGQSLGGAVAIPVMAQMPEVKAAVIEGGFPSYRTMAREVLSRSILTWILYPIYPLFIPTKHDPLRYLDLIPPRPLFFIHGTNDRVVPPKMSEILFKNARDPKTLWIVEGAGHMSVRKQEGSNYEKRIAEFLTEALRAQN